MILMPVEIDNTAVQHSSATQQCITRGCTILDMLENEPLWVINKEQERK